MANSTATSMYFYLSVDITMLLLAIVSFFGNGLIFFVIMYRPSLRKNEALLLIAALSLADCLLGLLILPYAIYLIADWGEEVNYSPYLVLPFSIPIVHEIKVNAVLSVSVAIDRLMAIQWPVRYRTTDKRRYANITILIATMWAIVDVALLFVMSEFKEVPGCAAAGCFFSKHFRYYWGISNMLVDLVAIAAIILLLIKLRAHNKSTTPAHMDTATRAQELKKFKHANMIAVNILIVSTVCIFLPSSLTGIGQIFGLNFHQRLGPIVALGLLLNGACNSFIYGLKHKEIRRSVFGLLNRSQISSFASPGAQTPRRE